MDSRDGRSGCSAPRAPRAGRYLGGLIGAFRPFATSRLRENANGVLAGEMLFAVRRGLPLDDVLEAACLRTPRVPPSTWNWLFFAAAVATAMAFSLFGPLGVVLSGFAFILLLLAAGATTQSDQYRQHVATTIARELRRGRSLHETFERHPALFGRFETTLIRAGERSGNMAMALTGWQRHARSAEKWGHTADMAIYPAIAVLIPIAGILLFLGKPAKRLLHTANTLHGPEAFPLLTALLGSFDVPFVLPAVFMVALTLVLVLLPRRFFNGNVHGSLFYLVFLFLVYMGVFWTLFHMHEDAFRIWAYSRGFYNADMLTIPAIPFSILFSFGVSLGVFFAARWMAGPGTGRVIWVLSFLPWMRQADRRLTESRFLFALGVLLEGGTLWPEALAEAGRATGCRRWTRAGAKAAERARQGVLPVETVGAIQALSPETRARLSAAEFAGQWPAAFLDAAEDSHRIGSLYFSMFTSVFFPLIHLLAGVLIGLFALALYYPLFRITSAIAYSIL